MTARPRLVCASANPDKVAEIAEILRDVAELLPRPAGVPDVVEDADSLAGNARLKAAAIAAATGEAAVADDTGLEVAALDGLPGVRTGRYAGEDATYADNRAKLLAAAGRRSRPGGAVPHRRHGRLARRARGRRRGRVRRRDRDGRAGRAGLRLRQRVRAATTATAARSPR